MKLQAVPTTTPEEREESYRRWLERKRTQAERRRAEEVMRRFREAERAEQQRARHDGTKEEKLAEWIRKKEEDIKRELHLWVLVATAAAASACGIARGVALVLAGM